MSKRGMLVFRRDMTRLDCSKEDFTGIRQCGISMNHEIWIMGKMVKEVSETEIALNPNAVADAYKEAFGFLDEQVKIV